MMWRRSQRLWNTDDCNSNRFRTDLYAIDEAQTCERGFGEEAAAAAEATERSLRGEMPWDPRRLSPPIPCTVCNGATTTKPQPVVTRHHLPKCPQCRRANKPTGYHLHTGDNNEQQPHWLEPVTHSFPSASGVTTEPPVISRASGVTKTPPVITKVGGVTTNPSVIPYSQWLPFPRG
jgi:hypothetical protein